MYSRKSSLRSLSSEESSISLPSYTIEQHIIIHEELPTIQPTPRNRRKRVPKEKIIEEIAHSFSLKLPAVKSMTKAQVKKQRVLCNRMQYTLEWLNSLPDIKQYDRPIS